MNKRLLFLVFVFFRNLARNIQWAPGDLVLRLETWIRTALLQDTTKKSQK